MFFKNDIVFFDLETTGINPESDRIIEIFCRKIHPNGSYNDLYQVFNPGIPIPPEASAVHGWTDEKVKNFPLFKTHAAKIFKFINGCDFGGFNVKNYDLPLLQTEFLRCHVNFEYDDDRLIADVFLLFKNSFSFKQEFLYKLFVGESLKDAHGAKADTLASMELLKKATQIWEIANAEQVKEIVSDELSRFIQFQNNEPVIVFGKYKDTPVTEVDREYLRWMVTKGDFPKVVKETVKKSVGGL